VTAYTANITCALASQCLWQRVCLFMLLVPLFLPVDQAMWPWPSLELSSLNPSTSPFAVLRHQQHPRISPLVPLPLPPGSTATSLIAKQPGTLCGQAYVQGQRRATSLSQAAPSLQPITTTKHQASGLYNTVSHDVGLNGLAR